jgi:glutamyl-tRNA synthetase
MNGEYVTSMPAERYYELAVHALAHAGLDCNKYPLEYVKAALDTCKEKIDVFAELPAFAGFYFTEEISYDPEAAKKDLTPENRPRLQSLREAYAALADFTAPNLEVELKKLATALGVKAGVMVHPTRLACTGRTAGPSLYHLLEVLGKDRVLARLDKALAVMG